MKHQFLLVPAAIIGASVPAVAQAKIFMTLENAQQLLFPGATFEEASFALNQNDFNWIIKDANVNIYNRNVKLWKVSSGGWFLVDQVRGKDDWISYAIGITAEGVVKNIEIIECLENYDGITIPAWRAQFNGKKRGATFDEIAIISGSTLSSAEMISGVKRILSTLYLTQEVG